MSQAATLDQAVHKSIDAKKAVELCDSSQSQVAIKTEENEDAGNGDSALAVMDASKETKQESDDDMSESPRTCYLEVYGLSKTIRKSQIYSAFSEFGLLKKCRIPHKEDRKKTPCLLRFASARSALAAVKACGEREVQVDGVMVTAHLVERWDLDDESGSDIWDKDYAPDWRCPNPRCMNHWNKCFGTKDICPNCGSTRTESTGRQPRSKLAKLRAMQEAEATARGEMLGTGVSVQKKSIFPTSNMKVEPPEICGSLIWPSLLGKEKERARRAYYPPNDAAMLEVTSSGKMDLAEVVVPLLGDLPGCHQSKGPAVLRTCRSKTATYLVMQSSELCESAIRVINGLSDLVGHDVEARKASTTGVRIYKGRLQKCVGGGKRKRSSCENNDDESTQLKQKDRARTSEDKLDDGDKKRSGISRLGSAGSYSSQRRVVMRSAAEVEMVPAVEMEPSMMSPTSPKEDK
eukprot:gnl/MRDRNA2_/MRDRNA2_102487_c0_seq1.p1 gnl/MRDRNA2_/MRDRNA2_102487_c0~~gnl/MRDRNA2_/MRDRNA2_102487_c0_seq1.p1  ORF type:complete len:462 (-),score=97.40 gnl/MRDRNA2_/MRDRNA2_102487_c0_seq1:2-1387(-)